MNISHEALSLIKEAVREAAYKNNMHIELSDTGDIFSRDKAFGVNWAAIGTVSPEETIKMAGDLLIMANIAKGLNALELHEIWKLGELKTGDGFSSDVITNRETYYELGAKYVEAAELGTLASLVEEDITYWDRLGKLF